MSIFKRGPSFYIDYYYKVQRIREAVASSDGEAQNYLIRRKAEIIEGRFQNPRRHGVTFAAFTKKYLEYSRINKLSWKRDVTALRRLIPIFGHYLLDEITPLAIEHYKAVRRERVAPSSVNLEISLLKNFFNKAIDEGLASGNPVRKVKLFRVENRRQRILSPKEIERLLSSCTPTLKAVVTMALHAGMRRSELLGLTWDGVDLTPGQETITLLVTKNGRMRRIPINSVLLPLLKDLKKKTGPEGLVFTFREGRKPGLSFKTAWAKVLRLSGIPHCRFHDLRGTFASGLVACGVDLVRVMELLGHQDVKTTMIYAQGVPEERRRAVELLPERYRVRNDHHPDLEENPERRSDFQLALAI